MTTVHVRVEMVEVNYPPTAPALGYRAYAADIGISAEGTTLESCIANIKSAIETYLGDTVELNWLRAEFWFSTE